MSPGESGPGASRDLAVDHVALVLANALRLVQNGMPYFRFEVPMMLLMFAAPIAALYALVQDWRDPSRR
jgi:hypothetical protein